MLSSEIMGRGAIGSQAEKPGIAHDIRLDEKGWNVLATRVQFDKDGAAKYNLDQPFRKTEGLINVKHRLLSSNRIHNELV